MLPTVLLLTLLTMYLQFSGWRFKNMLIILTNQNHSFILKWNDTITFIYFLYAFLSKLWDLQQSPIPLLFMCIITNSSKHWYCICRYRCTHHIIRKNNWQFHHFPTCYDLREAKIKYWYKINISHCMHLFHRLQFCCRIFDHCKPSFIRKRFILAIFVRMILHEKTHWEYAYRICFANKIKNNICENKMPQICTLYWNCEIKMARIKDGVQKANI